MTPVFSHGSLRLYLLSLLAEAPRHGYEMIQALSNRFGGTYSPSAGTIYPRLAKLEDEGLVTKTSDGRKTVYEITDAGRAELAAREDELNAIELEMTDSVRRLADQVRAGVTEAMKSLKADLASAAGEASSKPKSERAAASDVDPRTTSRIAFHEADVAISEFRNGIRSELRRRAANGSLTDETVKRLRDDLDRVRDGILTSNG
ncbi:hypothetical protein GCM10027416_32880 [Okibacterium endophyticum]